MSPPLGSGLHLSWKALATSLVTDCPRPTTDRGVHGRHSRHGSGGQRPRPGVGRAVPPQGRARGLPQAPVLEPGGWRCPCFAERSPQSLSSSSHGFCPGLCLAIQSHLTLCDPMDCFLPGSSLHGILQAGILEWVAISSSRGSP